MGAYRVELLSSSAFDRTEGHANKEIAHLLSISAKTVRNHIGNISSKLHVCDRTQAVLYAICKGLVKV